MFLHKIQQTHAKRFDWPKHDDIDRGHSTCVFFGPVHLKGNGPFEVIDLVELEAVFQSFRSGGQNNYTLINGVKMPSLTQNLHFNISQKPSSKLMMNNAHANH